ncbi:hypothetical protein ACPOL_3467 [Acidisarcina polymorpha]|uniref:Uncharacterized protein n=1 Tax=Acidisarcina polymorpha TaxID=2211140 RepID=A0A2Z5G0X3_9BACT|nr:hypothetical protein ACPOL_3467 [Acidisarcina polymorpha]
MIVSADSRALLFIVFALSIQIEIAPRLAWISTLRPSTYFKTYDCFETEVEEA